MKRFIFGFQRRVWWPKWTPASRSSLMETTDTGLPLSVVCTAPTGPGGTGRIGPAPPPAAVRRVGCENRGMVPASVREPDGPKAARSERDALRGLGAQIRDRAWDLAHEVVEEGLADETVPSLARAGQLGQLGDLPTFIAELGRRISDPEPRRVALGNALAALVRDHAREREALGFTRREIVTEFLLLRRVLWRFVSRSAALAEAGEA